MYFESRSEDGVVNCIVTGLANNSPYFEEMEINGKKRQYAKFYLQYQFKRNLEGEKILQTIPCLVFRSVLLDLCKSIKKYDSIIVIGARQCDKIASDKCGKQVYSIQVSDIFHMSMYYECMAYFREAMKYDKGIREVYQKKNRMNHQSINYAGDIEHKFDAEF